MYKNTRKKAIKQIYKQPLFTLDKSELMSLISNIEKDLLAQKEDNKECCGGHSNGKSTYVDNMAKIYGVKVKHPTPSPLEIEEIEETSPDEFKDFRFKFINGKINQLISNQKKLYQLIKEKL